MSSWRKKLFGFIMLALLIVTIVFWGSVAGGVCLVILIQSSMIYLFSDVASRDLAKTFEEEGEHVKGWREFG